MQEVMACTGQIPYGSTFCTSLLLVLANCPNKVNIGILSVSLTGNLLWSAVSLGRILQHGCVKMVRIHVDYTEIVCVCTPLGHLSPFTIDFDSCKYTKLWSNKCRLTFQSWNRIAIRLLQQELEKTHKVIDTKIQLHKDFTIICVWMVCIRAGEGWGLLSLEKSTCSGLTQ